MSDSIIQFPGDFLWGAGTSAYQIEGGWNADGKGESVWDRWCHTPGHVSNGDTGDVACNHYHLWEEDVDLMARLGLKSYRFSISWPRVLPTGRGSVNRPGLDFYARLVDRLLEKGIQPNITLFHWDLPQALEDKGGWLDRSTAEAFAEYAELLTGSLGDRVKLWSTLNEPGMPSFGGYRGEGWPPGANDLGQALQAAHNLLVAHGMAVQAMRAARPDVQVGIVVDFWPVDTENDSEALRHQAEMIWQGRFTWFLDPILRGAYPSPTWEAVGENQPEIAPGDFELMGQPLDWLGVNFYSRVWLTESGNWSARAPEAEYTDLGWEVHPESLYWLLTMLKDEYNPPPLYVTENGAFFQDIVTPDGRVHDNRRTDYLKAHFQQAHRAMQAGVDLRGYYVWSLFDNFEWLKGYDPRFGIIYVDYATQKRIPKDSALWYAQVIANSGFQV